MDAYEAAAQGEEGADESGCCLEGGKYGAEFGALVELICGGEVGDGGGDVAVGEGLFAADGGEFGGFSGGGFGEEFALD